MSTLHDVRVVVAGGGLAGLSAAFELSRRGAARARARGPTPARRPRPHRSRRRRRPRRSRRRVHRSAARCDPRPGREPAAAARRRAPRRVRPGAPARPAHDHPSLHRPRRGGRSTRRLRPIVDAYRDAGGTWDTAAAVAHRAADGRRPGAGRPGVDPGQRGPRLRRGAARLLSRRTRRVVGPGARRSDARRRTARPHPGVSRARRQRSPDRGARAARRASRPHRRGRRGACHRPGWTRRPRRRSPAPTAGGIRSPPTTPW